MSALPEPFRTLSGEIRKLQEQVRRLTNASPFSGTPIRPQADGTVQSDDFDGDLDAGDAGTQGWALSSLKAAFGELILRPGSIGNDSLTDPVKVQTYRTSALGFSLNTSWVEKAGVDITVPDGFTQASVALSGRLYAVNQNTTGGSDGTGTDAIYVRVGIDGNYTVATPTGVSGSNGFATTVGIDSFDLSSLMPGSTIRLSAQGTTGYQSIASYVDNYINGVATVTWLR